MKVAYWGGEVDIQPGMRVTLQPAYVGKEPDVFEVIGPTGSSIYSPSGLGGTPIFRMRLISGQYRERNRDHTPHGKDYWIDRGLPFEDDFCGDSIASAIAQQAERS